MKSKYPINNSSHQINNSPPTFGDRRRHLPPPAAYLWRFFRLKKKKKKKDKSDHWGWPRSTPTAKGRDPATLSGHICLRWTNQKKKKFRPLGVAVIHPQRPGVAAIHPNGEGERDPATPSGHFCLSGEPKKFRRAQKIVSNASKIDSNATNSFLMPQN